MAEAESRRALREFRALLRTERFPEGSRFSGIKEIQAVTGVGRTIAHQTLKLLETQGEIAVRHGGGPSACVVLAAPRPNDMDTLLAELDTATTKAATAAMEVQEAASRVWQARQAERSVEISEHRAQALAEPPQT